MQIRLIEHHRTGLLRSRRVRVIGTRIMQNSRVNAIRETGGSDRRIGTYPWYPMSGFYHQAFEGETNVQ